MSFRRPHVALRAKRKLAALGVAGWLLLGAGGGGLELERIDGSKIRLAPKPGETVVAHLWATWCRTCIEELPALAEAAAACGEGRVRVVTVNVGEDVETIAEYREQHDFALPILRDPKGRVWRKFARGLPVNVFLTAEGQRADFGPRDEAAWRSELQALGCGTARPAP